MELELARGVESEVLLDSTLGWLLGVCAEQPDEGGGGGVAACFLLGSLFGRPVAVLVAGCLAQQFSSSLGVDRKHHDPFQYEKFTKLMKFHF